MSLFKHIILSLIALVSISVQAQKRIEYTGVWSGKFYDNTAFGLVEDEYKFEVQIAQTNTGLEGVTYSYLNTSFYGKATHNGFIKTVGNKIVIQETKLVEVRSMGGGACLMTCTMKYSKVGAEEILEGTYTSIDSKVGSPCEGGYVKLKRVQKSIFGIDKGVQTRLTELAKLKAKKDKSIARAKTPKPNNTNTSATIPKPKAVVPKPNNTTASATIPKPKAVVPKPNNTTASTKPKDTFKTTQVITITKPNIAPPIIKAIPPPPTAILKNRSTELVSKIPVIDTAEYIVKFYDYGEVDGDRVTILLNNEVIVNDKMLDSKPIEVKVKLNPSTPKITITMVAENLGTIPPNTAFMVVYIAGKRYEAKIESTEQKNASIQFEYTGQ